MENRSPRLRGRLCVAALGVMFTFGLALTAVGASGASAAT